MCVCMNYNALCAHVKRLFVYVSFYGQVLWSCGTSCFLLSFMGGVYYSYKSRPHVVGKSVSWIISKIRFTLTVAEAALGSHSLWWQRSLSCPHGCAPSVEGRAHSSS